MADETDKRITSANDVKLTIGSQTIGGDTSLDAAIVVDEFEFNVSQDKPTESGVGYTKPQGRIYGNMEITFSFTLMGEDATIFNEVANPDSLINAVVTGNSYKWKIKDLDYTEFSVSGSDGEAVEFSADLNALDYERSET